MLVKTYSRINDGHKQVAPNFLIREFASKCGSDSILIDDRLPQVLQHIRKLLGNKPVIVISGFRTPEHNTRIGGAARLLHMEGRAADLTQTCTDLVTMCRAAESALIKYKIPGGICIYPRSNFIHVDVRPQRWRGHDDGDGRGARSISGWTPLESNLPSPINEAPAQAPQTGISQIKPYRVRISVAGLNVRRAPGTNFGIVTVIRDKGIYSIVEERNGIGASRWGRIENGSNSGWISLDHVVTAAN